MSRKEFLSPETGCITIELEFCDGVGKLAIILHCYLYQNSE